MLNVPVEYHVLADTSGSAGAIHAANDQRSRKEDNALFAVINLAHCAVLVCDVRTSFVNVDRFFFFKKTLIVYSWALLASNGSKVELILCVSLSANVMLSCVGNRAKKLLVCAIQMKNAQVACQKPDEET